LSLTLNDKGTVKSYSSESPKVTQKFTTCPNPERRCPALPSHHQGRISQAISKGKTTAQVNWNWQIFTDEPMTERLVAACYNCPSPVILSLDLHMSATSEISAPQKPCTVSRDAVSVEHKVKRAATERQPSHLRGT
jgi:hypothetical protein